MKLHFRNGQGSAIGKLLYLIAWLWASVLFLPSLSAGPGPQLASFTSNEVLYASLTWQDKWSNQFMRVEISTDQKVWFSDDRVLPVVSTERTGDLNRILYRVDSSFFPADLKFFRLGSTRPRPEGTTPDTSAPQGGSVLLTLSGTDPNASPRGLERRVTILPQHGRLFDGPTPSRVIGYPHQYLKDPLGRVLYVPNPDFIGADVIAYKLSGLRESSSRLVRIDVGTATQLFPIATAQDASLDEDTSKVLTLSASDPSGNPDALDRVITALPAHGRLFDGITPDREIIAANAVLIDPQFRVLYVPAANFNGPDLISYKVRRGSAESSVQPMHLTINPVNDFPVAQSPSANPDEDTPVLLALWGYDVDGDSLKSIVRALPNSGKLYQVQADGVTRGAEFTSELTEVSNPLGLVLYVPDPNFNGSDSVRYDLDDGFSLSQRVTLNISVRPVNDPLTALPQLHIGDIAEPLAGVLLHVTDVDSAPMGRITSFPAKGNLYRRTVSPDNLITPQNNTFAHPSLVYEHAEPPTGDSVQYSFSYQVTDGEFTTDVITDTIEIRKTNELPLPTGTPGAVTTLLGRNIEITLNGIDPDGDSSALQFRIVAPPQHGALSFQDITGGYVEISAYPFTLPQSDPSAGWKVQYTPAQVGEDSFEFTLQDQHGLFYYDEEGGNTVRVNIAVTAENHPPVAAVDTVLIDEDTSVIFALWGSDADGDPLRPTLRLVPGHGKLYQVAGDGVTPGSQITESPTVITNPQGLVHYVPDQDFNGGDTIRHDVFDGITFSARVTTTLGIRPVNDLPVAHSAVHIGQVHRSVMVVILNLFDVDGPLLGRITQFPAKGRLYRKSVSPQNLITPDNNAFFDLDLQYVHEEPVSGPTVEYSFSYTVQDGDYTSSPITDTIRVEQTNLPPSPVGTPTDVAVKHGEGVDITLNGNDPDGDNSALLFRIVTPPQHGVLASYDLNDTPVPILPFPFLMPSSDPSVGWRLRYTSNDGVSDSFEFTLQGQGGVFYEDADGQSAIRVNIAVLPPNRAPAATAAPVITNEDTPIIFALSGSDPDGDPLTSTIHVRPQMGALYQVEPDGVTPGAQITHSPAVVTNPSGLVLYIPIPDYNGMPTADSVFYDVFDGQQFSDRVTLNIAIRPINDLPVVHSATHIGDFDRSTVTSILLDIVDVDSPISGRITVFPTDGMLYRKTISPANLITPENNTFNATDLLFVHDQPPPSWTGSLEYSFTYELTDGGITAGPITDIIQLTKRNQMPLPTGSPTQVTTRLGEPIDIILNGIDPDGDSAALGFTVLHAPQHGSLAFINLVGNRIPIQSYPFLLPSSNPSHGWGIRYTPTAAGPDFVEFTLRDNHGLYFETDDRQTAIRINIDVLPNLEPDPTGSQSVASTKVARPIEIVLTGVDPDGDSAALRFTILEPPDLGALAIYNSSGQPVIVTQYPFVMPSSTPAQGWKLLYIPTTQGADFIEFVLQDQYGLHYTAGTGEIKAVPVNILVLPNLEPEPTASPTFAQINTGRTQVFTLGGIDPDGSSSALRFTALAAPQQGTLRYYTGTTFATIPSYPFTLPISSHTTGGWFLQYIPTVVGLYSFEVTVHDEDGIYYTAGNTDGQPQRLKLDIQVDPRP